MAKRSGPEYEKRRGSTAPPLGRGTPGQARDTFVRLELTEADKKQLADYVTTLDELDAALEGMMADGYKISVKYDDYSKSIAAFAFPPEDDSNAGYILTGRGRYPTRALRQLLYKHHGMLGEDWTGAGSPTPADDTQEW